MEVRLRYLLKRPAAALIASAALAGATPSLAQLPEPVRDMIDAAIATGDEEKARTVIEIARAANPQDAAEIDALLTMYETDLAEAQAAEERAERREIRNAGFFENWSGQGELGAFNSTGNAENTGITAAISLTREGIDWSHTLRGRADYQESNGVTTREQFLAAYEPNLRLSQHLFAYALALYERDRFQGFSARYAVSGGLGYDIFDREALSLSVQAGPAYRRTELVDGSSTSSVAGNASLDLDWQISPVIALTQDASAFVQSGSSTFISDTGLQADIADSLAVRLSYTLEHDTDPPQGAEKTDTLSRVTIIYDF